MSVTPSRRNTPVRPANSDSTFSKISLSTPPLTLPRKSCSLLCFKSHKPTHETDTEQPNPTPAPPSPATTFLASLSNSAAPPAPHQTPAPPAPQPTPTITPLPPPLERLRTHPSFLPLFTRHPSLRAHLKTIYTATQPPLPGADDFSEQAPRLSKHQRGGYRGRHRERPKGPWTQEKGEQYALRILRGMRKGADGDGEGLEEFGRLVGMIFAGEEESGEKRREGG